jgi:predicted metalloprotease with PDZ domain
MVIVQRRLEPCQAHFYDVSRAEKMHQTDTQQNRAIISKHIGNIMENSTGFRASLNIRTLKEKVNKQKINSGATCTTSDFKLLITGDTVSLRRDNLLRLKPLQKN